MPTLVNAVRWLQTKPDGVNVAGEHHGASVDLRDFDEVGLCPATGWEAADMSADFSGNGVLCRDYDYDETPVGVLHINESSFKTDFVPTSCKTAAAFAPNMNAYAAFSAPTGPAGACSVMLCNIVGKVRLAHRAPGPQCCNHI